MRLSNYPLSGVGAILFALFPLFLISCGEEAGNKHGGEKGSGDFEFKVDQFADLKILRYQIPGFEELPLEQKKLCYYLYEAAMAGRDIMWDQNYKHNLCVRRTLEAVINNYSGDTADESYQRLLTYAKRVWVSNGIHHHYANTKLIPECSSAYFAELVKATPEADLPLGEGESVEDLIGKLTPVMFDASFDGKKVEKKSGVDKIESSAINFYEGVTEAEVKAFYSGMLDASDTTPISYGLNSKLVKENGTIVEKVWKVDGMYSAAIEKIVYWLEKASSVAENPQQKKTFDLLAKYYRSGDLEDFNDYNVAWVADTNSVVDVINGFIEVYNDPLGRKGSFESVVSIKDQESSKRIEAFSKEAQWFEDNSPLMEEHKKKNVKGISAKVITVVTESGDASPTTPIGINLPNEGWIRARVGSKSVNLGNIVYAYDAASKGGGFLDEFAYSEEEKARSKKYGSHADVLHTDIHEVLGHASGQLEPGVKQANQTMGEYYSTLEEARADLFALYYIGDEKLKEMGLVDSDDLAKAAFDDYIRNGLMTQLKRIEPGESIEEDHMRNRQLICKWAYERGEAEKVIERKERDGKTYFVINDYEKLREYFGELLRETQRIKSQGDFEAGKALVENYGVEVDKELHKEVLERFEKLGIAPYGAFINPRLVAVEENGEITDIKVEYPEDFVGQMLEYGKTYSTLPTYN